MEFMLFIATDPEAEPDAEPGGLSIEEWVDEMTRRGVSIAAIACVRPSTRGPFACAAATRS